LPETKLGLIPGWGGTQRLPRLIGIELAVQMLVSGDTILANKAVKCGLANKWGPSAGLTDAALVLLHSGNWKTLRAAKQAALPDVSLPPVQTGKTVAERAAVGCVLRGVRVTTEEGLRLETEAFLQLAGSNTSKQLIAEFFASRKKAT
jgi:enoyl-CoA hydratase/carnithine racemase